MEYLKHCIDNLDPGDLSVKATFSKPAHPHLISSYRYLRIYNSPTSTVTRRWPLSWKIWKTARESTGNQTEANSTCLGRDTVPCRIYVGGKPLANLVGKSGKRYRLARARLDHRRRKWESATLARSSHSHRAWSETLRTGEWNCRTRSERHRSHRDLLPRHRAASRGKN